MITNQDPANSINDLEKNIPKEKNNRQSASWDVQNAFRNYSILVVSQFATAFFSFASVWLIIRYSGAEFYGGIIAIIAASQIIQIFINWTGVALIRFGVEEFIKTGKIRNSFWGRIYILVPNVILLFAVAVFWFPSLSTWLKLPSNTFLLVVAHLLGGAFWLHIQYSLQGVKLPKLQGILPAIEKFLVFLIVSFLILSDRLSIEAAIITYAVAPLVSCVVAIWYIRNLVSVPSPFQPTQIKKIVLYSLPLFPFSVIGYFSSSYLDAIFILQFLNVRELAVYSVASQIGGIVLQLPILANTLLLPMFVTMQTNEQGGKIDNYFLHVVPLLTVLWGGFCLVLSVFGYYLLPLVFGEAFAQAGIILWILLTASSFSVPTYFGYAALANSHLLSKVSLYSTLCSAVVNVTLNFLLIPRFGMIGCALGTAASLLVGVASFAFFLRKKMPLSISWVPAALLPTITALIVIIVFSSPFWAVVVWLMCFLTVIVLFYASVRKGIKILVNYL